MAAICTMCGKKIGGLENKEYFFNTGLELCAACKINVDVLEQRLKNSKSSSNLDSRFAKIVDNINNKYKISDENKAKYLHTFRNIYMYQKRIYIETELREKINQSEIDRKHQLENENHEIDDILKTRKDKSHLQAILDINNQYEYEVVPINDTQTGEANFTQLQIVLSKYSVLGWRLKTIISNELGKNSTIDSFNKTATRYNATIDQLLLVFERKISNAKK